MASAFFFESLHMVSESARKPHVGLETLPHKVGHNEDVRDLSRGDYDAQI